VGSQGSRNYRKFGTLPMHCEVLSLICICEALVKTFILSLKISSGILKRTLPKIPQTQLILEPIPENWYVAIKPVS